MILTTLAYLRDGERTLMLQRPDEPARPGGRWNGLGGKFEPGESPERCLRREVREESGLEVEHAELKGIITFPAFTRGVDVMTFVYVVRSWRGQLVPDGPEGTLHWIPTREVASLDLWSGDVVFLPWLELSGYFSARLRYDEGVYLDHEVVFYADASAAVSSGASDVNAS